MRTNVPACLLGQDKTLIHLFICLCNWHTYLCVLVHFLLPIPLVLKIALVCCLKTKAEWWRCQQTVSLMCTFLLHLYNLVYKPTIINIHPEWKMFLSTGDGDKFDEKWFIFLNLNPHKSIFLPGLHFYWLLQLFPCQQRLIIKYMLRPDRYSPKVVKRKMAPNYLSWTVRFWASISRSVSVSHFKIEKSTDWREKLWQH